MLLFSLGWLGTVVYLGNHGYVSLIKDWRPNIYFSFNLLAATLLTIQSVALASWQAAAINGFWILISALLLAKVKINFISISATAYLSSSVMVLLFVAVTAFAVDVLFYYKLLAWSSAYFFCSSYLLFSAKCISTRAYLFANVYAAIALLPQLWITQNLPVFTLEIAWAGLSVVGIVKSYSKIHLID